MLRRRLSLRNRLALLFFGITLLAVGGLYLFVVPGLQNRLMGAKLNELAIVAREYSGSAVVPAASQRSRTSRTSGGSSAR